MLIFEPQLTSEVKSDPLREDGLTVCHQTIVGVPLSRGEIRMPVYTVRVSPFDWKELEWRNILRGLDTSDSVSNSIEETIIEHLIDVPEVVEAYFSREGDAVDLWTIIDHSERRVRFAVYEKELEIRRRLRGFFINFRVSGRETSPSPASMGYRRVDFNVRRANAEHPRPPRPGQA